MFRIITWSILIVIAIQCVTATNTTTIHKKSALKIQENIICPLLFHYNNETGESECLGHLFNKFGITLAMCANNRAFIYYTYCMTYDEVTNTHSASFCSYFELSGYNTSDFAPGFISLYLVVLAIVNA